MKSKHMLGATAITALAQPGSTSSESQHPMVPDNFICTHPHYSVQIVSSAPLMLYLGGFLTEAERLHLQSVSASLPQASHDSPRNTGTPIPTDEITSCIQSRLLSLQGHDVPPSHVEPLHLARHTTGHAPPAQTDWFADDHHRLAMTGGNRISSLFATVRARNDTTGGGINFPLIRPPAEESWCDRAVDCDQPWARGVTFRPVEGDALYWRNLGPDGAGDARTRFQRIEVTSGEVVALAIRTRQAAVTEEAKY